MLFAAIGNKKLIYFLFTGYAKIPITCCQVSNNFVENILKKAAKFQILLLFFI